MTQPQRFALRADDTVRAANPGVQGLAQLGRNAIERVTELERELAAVTAERDAANAYASDLNDSLIAANAEAVALEAERDQLRARLAAIDNAPTVDRSTFVRGEICGCQTRPTHYVGEIDCPWHKRGDGQPKEPT